MTKRTSFTSARREATKARAESRKVLDELQRVQVKLDAVAGTYIAHIDTLSALLAQTTRVVSNLVEGSVYRYQQMTESEREILVNDYPHASSYAALVVARDDIRTVAASLRTFRDRLARQEEGRAWKIPPRSSGPDMRS